MAPDVNRELFNDLGEWGYQLISPGGKSHPGMLLKQLIEADDHRILEGFPIILTRWLEEGEKAPPVDLAKTEEEIKSSSDRKKFRTMVAITLYLITMFQSDEIENALIVRKYLEKRDPELIKMVRNSFVHDQEIRLGNLRISPNRIQRTYINYTFESRTAKQESLSQDLERARKIAFNESLNELFSARQAEIISKILDGKELSKTEREYFSRIIKKRLMAIANPDLQTLASSILPIIESTKKKIK